VAAVLLFAAGPLVATHQTFAYGYGGFGYGGYGPSMARSLPVALVDDEYCDGGR
jgi:hypothetical protein